MRKIEAWEDTRVMSVLSCFYLQPFGRRMMGLFSLPASLPFIRGYLSPFLKNSYLGYYLKFPTSDYHRAVYFMAKSLLHYQHL